MHVNQKSRIDGFISQLSSVDTKVSVIENQQYDVTFKVKVRYKIKAITSIVDNAVSSGNERESIAGKSELDEYIKSLTSPIKYTSNGVIISNSRVSNYGYITDEVKIGDDKFVSYLDICETCGGEGKIVCRNCKSEKVIKCVSCGGVGCKECRNLGWMRCDVCDDEGYEICPSCLNSKAIEKVFRIETRCNVSYEIEFSDSTEERIKDAIKAFGRVSELKTKDIAYISSAGQLEVHSDCLSVDFYVSCPINFVKVRYGEKVSDVVLYGVSQKVMDLSGFTEALLKNEEYKLYEKISDTNMIGGNYSELIASINDYAEVPMHKRIMSARNAILRRDEKPTAELISEEMEKVLSSDYVSRFLENLSKGLRLASICVKAKFMLPALAVLPFVHGLIGLFLEDPLRIVVSVIFIFAVYMTSNVYFDSIVKKYGTEGLINYKI